MSVLSRLRNARLAFAESDTKTTTPPEGEIAGHGSGTVSSSYIGKVEAEVGTYSPERVSFATMRKMQRDPTIKACTALSELALRFAPWDVDGPDPRVTEFVRAALEPVWGAIVKSCGRTGAYEGCAPHELVWQRTDTRVVVTDPDTGAQLDETITGWTLAKVKDIDPASLQSILVNGLEDFRGYGLLYGTEKKLDADKAFHFASGMRFGNWWGEGRLATVYDSWYAHRILHALFMRFMARRTTPAVHVEFPAGEDADGNANSETARAIASGFQSDATSAWTQAADLDAGMPGWTISLIEDAQRAATATAFLSGMKAMEFRMMLGLLTPEKVLNGDGGSNALSDTHKDIWILGVQGTLQEIIDAVNAQIVPRLVRYTFGDVPVPRVTSVGLSDDSKVYLGTLFTELVKTGGVTVDGDSIAERLSIPTIAGESAQTEGEEDASAAMSDVRDAAMRLAEELQAKRVALAAKL